MTNTDNNYLTEAMWDRVQKGYNVFQLTCLKEMKDQLLSNQESIIQIREYLAVMENEPEGYIKISEVYHSIRRMLNDE